MAAKKAAKRSAPPRKPVVAAKSSAPAPAPSPPEKPLLYIKVGGPPTDWRKHQVVDQKGRVIPDVYEADAHNGWLLQAVRGPDGRIEARDGRPVTRRLVQPIRIERRP